MPLQLIIIVCTCDHAGPANICRVRYAEIFTELFFLKELSFEFSQFMSMISSKQEHFIGKQGALCYIFMPSICGMYCIEYIVQSSYMKKKHYQK